ncbi:NAD(P)/FAD-dependent oxidoreductase [Pectinatus frisingensis]|uniref:NAD(P)/FAD-dependent oxidoreductase n=1 Tax=Pectinatus frisingensis TaxID=865 RepID=UPI0018C7B47A|nr:NAD(P)/FAD-dependent oxidoreductase [Pectinatus frisingensis]
MKKTAIIIGAGPAGLTAAYELLKNTDITPIIFESSDSVGGLSRTINYKGNRMDIGGHRFFSKSEIINKWWTDILPLQTKKNRGYNFTGQSAELPDNQNFPVDPEQTDNVMLVRSRLSRIFFLKKFFDYPLSIKWRTFANLGLSRTIKIILSYLYISLFPIKSVKTLEDFFINHFGRELYNTFFKDYTEKVWGLPCCKIRPDWGAQRVKGLSIWKLIKHALQNLFVNNYSLTQKNIETSLIEQFMYPKYGPGQLWEEVAAKITQHGGIIKLRCPVKKLSLNSNKINGVWIKNTIEHKTTFYSADFFLSSMPIRDLIKAMPPAVPPIVTAVAAGLIYRDFITVGLLCKKIKLKNKTKLKTRHGLIPDNWIYIQEKSVKLGRLQIFNNWSPYLVNDDNNVWLGLEYFCTEGDELWSKTKPDFTTFAIKDLEKIAIVNSDDILDSIVVKVPKAYPAYFGTYDKLPIIREFIDKFNNLYLIGRNGMHRYNNMDHSMLTAMAAVKNITHNISDKTNIWSINADQCYQEDQS